MEDSGPNHKSDSNKPNDPLVPGCSGKLVPSRAHSKMPHRYYHSGDWFERHADAGASSADADADSLWLTGQEAHHLLHVMRQRPGEEIELFNGRGGAALARIEEATKREVRVRIVQGLSSEDQAGQSPLILATAVPKGDRFRWLVEKATELGVTQMIPLQTQRSVVSPRETKLEKQQQYVIEACKQSGRNTLLEIRPVCTLQDCLATLPDQSALLLGNPYGEPVDGARLARLLPPEWRKGDPLVILVGPEGGFTNAEEQQIQARQAVMVRLTPHILRTETAGLALITLANLLASSRPEE